MRTLSGSDHRCIINALTFAALVVAATATITNRSPDGLWITDTFARSHRMSTYLVAFAVTNFESRTAGNVSNATN
jgi:aminopeptidase N